MTDTERYDFDVVVIGAGGAGLRAAIEPRERERARHWCASPSSARHTQ